MVANRATYVEISAGSRASMRDETGENYNLVDPDVGILVDRAGITPVEPGMKKVFRSRCR